MKTKIIYDALDPDIEEKILAMVEAGADCKKIMGEVPEAKNRNLYDIIARNT